MAPSEPSNATFRALDRPDLPVRRVPAGSSMVVQGAVGAEMYLLKRGRAEVRVHGAEVEEIGPGGIFGEMALIDQSTRSATVVAIEDCEIVALDEERFIQLIQDSPYFALDVMRALVVRLRAMNRRI
ncbi:MAG: cyclic nucleotide-binding domain-containing protein [Rhizobiales bacterium]|nr:cyclic nucleotide-binding domain-containing protein [Hyphomicrobiales bacterium]